MKCPHCQVLFHAGQTYWSVGLGADADGLWLLSRSLCPNCNRFVLGLETVPPTHGGPALGQQNIRLVTAAKALMIWPKGVSRTPVPPEVPEQIAEDYREACLVFND